MTNKRSINNCSNCESDRVIPEKFCDIYYVVCKNCKESTSDHDYIIDAINEWNNKNKNTK